MGLFKRNQQAPKRPPIDETADGVQRFFDGYFSELRSRGQQQFEKTAEQHGEVFKKDLDATLASAGNALKEHLARQLEQQFIENNKDMKEAQDIALQTLNQSTKTLQQQHQQLSEELQKNVSEHQTILANAFEENRAQVASLKQTHEAALNSLISSVQELQQQHQQLAQKLQQNVADQETMLVTAFEQNMAQIIEHYLLGALGDQYDLKAQLPSIIKQMEASKQAIVDDMKL